MPQPLAHVGGHYPVPPAPVAAAPAPAAEPSAPAEPAGEEELKGHVIHSPMVGTFYRAPSPGAKSFVEIGALVEAGDVATAVPDVAPGAGDADIILTLEPDGLD